MNLQDKQTEIIYYNQLFRDRLSGEIFDAYLEVTAL